MSTIVLRSSNGGPLTNNQVDANFNNLNTTKAELDSPIFTTRITTPILRIGATDITATPAQLNFVAGVTSAIQTQLDSKAQLNSPSFTTGITTPAITLGATALTATGAQLNFVAGVTSAIQTQIDTKAQLAGPTGTGTATWPTFVSTDTTDASSTTTGAIKTAGGLGVAKKLYVGTDLIVLGTTDTTGIGVGSLQINGGASFAKSVWVSDYVNIGPAGGVPQTKIGVAADYMMTIGSSQCRVGTSPSASFGSGTVVLGVNALTQPSGLGLNNTAIGGEALKLNTTGSGNVGVGYQAGLTNLTGGGNTAVGWKALTLNTASSNTGVGIFAGGLISTGQQNTVVGGQALATLSSGNQQAAFGYYALRLSAESFNTGIGAYAGQNITSGNGNVCIGNSAGTEAGTVNLTTQSNYVTIGNNATTNAVIKVAWTVSSDQRDKTDFADVPHGLDFITQLKPTAYQYSVSREDNSPAIDGRVRYGFLAQDILELEGDTPVVIDNRDTENLKFNESSLIAVMVKAIQELKSEFDAYKATHP